MKTIAEIFLVVFTVLLITIWYTFFTGQEVQAMTLPFSLLKTIKVSLVMLIGILLSNRLIIHTPEEGNRYVVEKVISATIDNSEGVWNVSIIATLMNHPAGSRRVKFKIDCIEQPKIGEEYNTMYQWRQSAKISKLILRNY